MKFQIVKIDGIHERILTEASLGIALKIRDVGLEPDGDTEVKGHADFLQSSKDFFGTGHVRVIVDDYHILKQMIVFEKFGPDAHEAGSFLWDLYFRIP